MRITNPFGLFLPLLFMVVLGYPAGPLWAEEPAGWITELSGEVSIIRPDQKTYTAEQGTELYRGDTIETGSSSHVTIELVDGSAVKVGEESSVKLVDLLYSERKRVNRSYFRLFKGTVRGILNNLFYEDSEMTFETPTSIAGVKGSDLMVWIEDGHTMVALNEGKGFVRQRDERFPKVIWLKQGWMVKVIKGKPVGKPFLMPKHIKKRFLKFPIKRHPELIKKLRGLKAKERRRLLKRLKGLPKPLRPHIERNIVPPELREPKRKTRKPKEPPPFKKEVPPFMPIPPQR